MTDSGSTVVSLAFEDHKLQVFIAPGGGHFLSILTPCERMGLTYQEQAQYIRERFPGFWREESEFGRRPILLISSRRVGSWLYSIRSSQCSSPRHRQQLDAYQRGLDQAIEQLLFGKTVSLQPMSPGDLLVEMATQIRDQGARLESVHTLASEAQQTAAHALHVANLSHGMTCIRGYLHLWNVPMTEYEASVLGRLASDECKRRGIHVQKVPDTRHGEVNAYPNDFLEEFFERRYGPKPNGHRHS